MKKNILNDYVDDGASIDDFLKNTFKNATKRVTPSLNKSCKLCGKSINDNYTYCYKCLKNRDRDIYKI
jgi:hypothetical protein